MKTGFHSVIVLIAAAATLLSTRAESTGSTVPPEFFGLIIHRAHLSTPWPTIPFGAWRLWDSYLKWSDIQPDRSTFDFRAFDRQVEAGRNHGKELTYTFGQTPRWASSRPDEKHAWGVGAGGMPRYFVDWTSYVERVVARYKGRMYAYEVWNEPKYQDTEGRCTGAIFFCGTPEQLVELTKLAHEIITRVDPNALLATPAFTDGAAGVERLDRYLAAGGSKYVQAVSFHFYAAEPETIPDVVSRLRAVMKKHGIERLPIWNSEFGYLVQNQHGDVTPEHPAGAFAQVFTQTQAGALVVRALLLAAASGIQRFTFYAWDDRRMGAVGSRDGEPHELAQALSTAHRWMVGARIECKAPSPGSDYMCTLKRDGRRARVYWNRSTNRIFGPLPVDARGRYAERLTDKGRHDSPPSDWDGAPLLVTDDNERW